MDDGSRGFSGKRLASLQNITGNWQGTLQAGPQKVRIVFKIAALDNDKLKATLLRRRNQPSPPIATTITRDGSTVKMTIPSINGAL